MTANAEAFQLSQAEISSEIKQANINAVASALLWACDLLTQIDDWHDEGELTDEHRELVRRYRELADAMPDDQLSALEISHEIKALNIQTLAALVLAFRDATTLGETADAFDEMCEFAQTVRDAA